MTETASALLAKSDQALRAAHALLAAKDAEGCINRAYYAAFHVASAALAEVGETTKTHRGTHNRFWIRFVETGQLPRTVADVLSYGWRMRERADYDAFSDFDLPAAAQLVEDVAVFVAATSDLVRRIDSR